MEITLKPIGEAIKEYLNKNNKSYSEFIKKAKISKSYLSEIITSNIMPSEEKLEKIANSMEVKPFYFREYRKMKINQYIDENPQILSFEEEEDLIKLINRISTEIKNTQEMLHVTMIEQLVGKTVYTETEMRKILVRDLLSHINTNIYHYNLKQSDLILLSELIERLNSK
jgi:transcriptional regulator with XRE-family HTH domain